MTPHRKDNIHDAAPAGGQGDEISEASRRARRICSIPGSRTVRGKCARAVLELHYMAGLTAREIASLRLDHVDVPGGRLFVVGGAGGTREVGLAASTVAALDDYIGARSEFALGQVRGLFVGFDSRTLTAKTVGDVLSRYARLDAAAQNDLRPQDGAARRLPAGRTEVEVAAAVA